jgi:hypothetical protein
MFDINCGDRMKRAADANSVELALEEMHAVVAYLETNHLTSGSTHVLWADPEHDIGFWYKNMKSAMDELEALPKEASSLEKSNVLIKLRETLLDGGEKGSTVTVPPGISLHPMRGFVMLMGLLSTVFVAIFGVIAIRD